MMNKKIMTVVGGILFSAVGLSFPQQVWGMDGDNRPCSYYKSSKQCNQKEKCNWLVVAPGRCYGVNLRCSNEFSLHNKELCDLYAKKYKCKWEKDRAFCAPKLPKGEKKKSPKT